MARLPSYMYLIQQIDGDVVLWREHYDEEEIVRFPVNDGDAVARAQHTIHLSEQLTDEDKCFAHFWSGYFYAHAGGL